MTERSSQEAIFFAALEKPDLLERAAFLDEACAGDTELRGQIERLLAAHPEAEGFLERPVAVAGDVAALAPSEPPDDPAEPLGDACSGEPPEHDTPLDFLAPSPTPDSLGRLGHYEVLEVVGRGGMGIVLRAFDEKLRRVVAIKVLAPQLATSAPARRRFVREARAAAAVSHDNVIAIHGVEDSGPVPYLVMQFIDGCSLQEKLERTGPLLLKEILRIALQVASGLAASHAQGLVHRDVKPANILLENGVERVKITDFGLARAVDDASLTQSGLIAGTPAYMSPEQARGEHVDQRSDLFSLGSVLYALSTGHAPFRASTTVAVLKRICDDTPRPVREVNPEMPDWLEAIVTRLLAKDPAERFETAAELAGLLRQHLMQQEPLDLVTPPPGREVRSQGRPARPPARSVRHSIVNRRTATAGLMLVLTAVLAGYLLSHWSRRGSGPATAAARPIRVGILHSQTGIMGTTESAAIDATLLAIEEINARGGLLGRKIEPVVVDNMSDPSIYAQEAERLITAEKVCTIFGCVTSLSRKAVTPVVEKYDHLLVDPMQYEGLEQSPNVFFTGALPNQQVTPAVRWCFDHIGKRCFIVGSDYVWPRAAGEVIRDAVAEWSGEIVGEEYLPMGISETEAVVQKIGQARPDVILEMIAGDTKVSYYRALRKAGITSAQIPSLSFSSPQPGLTAQDCAGDYAAWNYFESIASPENRGFVARFHARYGRLRSLSDPLESSYVGVHLWAQAVEAAGTPDAAAIRRALPDRRFRAPEGEVRVDPETQHLWKTARVARLTSEGTAEIVWTSDEPIRPVVFPGSRPREQWQTFLTGLRERSGEQSSAPESASDTLPRQTRLPLTREQLAERPSPLDTLKDSPMDLPENTPPEVVAVFGEPTRFQMPDRTSSHWMAQTRDGGLLAVPNGVGILLFAARTGALVRTLSGHTSQPNRPAFSSDGKRLASGSANSIVRVWDVATGREELTLEEHVRPVLCVDFEPSGNRLVSADADGTIKVWDRQGALLTSFQGHHKEVSHMAFSPDGKRLATASNDGTLKLWNPADWHEIRALGGKEQAFTTLAWSKDGMRLAAGDDVRVIVWDADDYQVIYTLKTAAGGLIAFTPDGRTLITGRHDCTERKNHAFRRFDLATGIRQKTYELGPTGGLAILQLSPDGTTVYATQRRPDKDRVRAYDAQTGQERFPPRGHSGPVRCVALSPDGRTLVSGGYDRTTCLWDLAGVSTGATSLPFRTLSRHKTSVWSVAFSPDATLLATSGSLDGLLILWDVKSGRMIRELPGHSRKSPRVAFSPDGALLAAGGEDGTVNVWDVQTGKREEPFRWNDGPVRSLAFSPDGRLLASGDRGTVQVIDRAARRRLHAFPGKSLFTNVAFSFDGALLAATSNAPDARLRLWDVATGREHESLTGHTDHILGLSLHPGGRLAATSSSDGRVILWDVIPPGRQERTIDFQAWDGARCVAFTPEGRYLAVGLQNGTVAITRVTP